MDNRRADDMRITKMEQILEKVREEVHKIDVQINNGYDKSIKSTENKVNYIDERNTKEHQILRDDIKSISVKLDRMLWAMVSVSFLLIVSEFVKGLL